MWFGIITNKRTETQLTAAPDKTMIASDDEDDLLLLDPNDDFVLDISESAISQLLGIISSNETEVTPLGKTALREPDKDKQSTPSNTNHETVSGDDDNVTLTSLCKSNSIDIATYIASPSPEITLLENAESLLQTDSNDINKSYSDVSISESAMNHLLGIEKTPDSTRNFSHTHDNHPKVATTISQEASKSVDTQCANEEINELDTEQSIEYILSLDIHCENVTEKCNLSAETILAMPVRRMIGSCEESHSRKAEIEPSGKSIDLEKEQIIKAKADKCGIDKAEPETFELQLIVESINLDLKQQVMSEQTLHEDKHKPRYNSCQAENAVQVSTKLFREEKVQIDFKKSKKKEESTALLGGENKTSSSTVCDKLDAQAKGDIVEKHSEHNVSISEMKSFDENPTSRKRDELEGSHKAFKKPRLIYINPAMVSRFTPMANCCVREANVLDVQAKSELTKSKSIVSKCTNGVNCLNTIPMVQYDSKQRPPVANTVIESIKATYNSEFQPATADVEINKELFKKMHAAERAKHLVNSAEGTSTKREIMCLNSENSSKTEHVSKVLTKEIKLTSQIVCSNTGSSPNRVSSRRVIHLPNNGKKKRGVFQQDDSRISRAIVSSNEQKITQQKHEEHMTKTDTNLEQKTLTKIPIFPDRTHSTDSPDLRVHVNPDRNVVKITNKDAHKKQLVSRRSKQRVS